MGDGVRQTLTTLRLTMIDCFNIYPSDLPSRRGAGRKCPGSPCPAPRIRGQPPGHSDCPGWLARHGAGWLVLFPLNFICRCASLKLRLRFAVPRQLLPAPARYRSTNPVLAGSACSWLDRAPGARAGKRGHLSRQRARHPWRRRPAGPSGATGRAPHLPTEAEARIQHSGRRARPAPAATLGLWDIRRLASN
jgi:hypothetical protein